MIKKIWQALYRLYAVRGNVKIGRHVHLGIGSILWASSKLNIGDNVYIGKYCTIECNGKIGNDVVIANQVGIIGRWDHDYRAVGKTIRQAPWIGDKNCKIDLERNSINIEDDIWIGYGAILLSGITVCRGAIIGAGALVKDNVSPYAIVAGVPAINVGRRLNNEEIIEHEIKVYGKVLSQIN